MSTHNFQCINFGECDLALSRQTIQIEDGEKPVCPTCEEKLVPFEPARNNKRMMISLAAAAVLVVAGLFAYLWLNKGHEPSPTAESLLSEYFPNLPASGGSQ